MLTEPTATAILTWNKRSTYQLLSLTWVAERNCTNAKNTHKCLPMVQHKAQTDRKLNSSLLMERREDMKELWHITTTIQLLNSFQVPKIRMISIAPHCTQSCIIHSGTPCEAHTKRFLGLCVIIVLVYGFRRMQEALNELGIRGVHSLTDIHLAPW
jgi:hypothetical protein